MKFIKLALAIASIALFLAACANTAAPVKTTDSTTTNNSPANTTGQTNAPTPNAELSAARELYTKQRCIECHQENGEGGNNIQFGDIAVEEVPSFKDPRHAKRSDETYTKKIKNGGDGMPKYKDKLNDDQIKLLVNYIRQEFQGKTN